MGTKERCPRCARTTVTEQYWYIFYPFGLILFVEAILLYRRFGEDVIYDHILYAFATLAIVAVCLSYFESFRTCTSCGHRWRWKFFGLAGPDGFKIDWKHLALFLLVSALSGVAAALVTYLLS